MRCSLCNKIIWFWQYRQRDNNNNIVHSNCFEDCEEVLELERKTAIKVKRESERLEKKRIEDAKKQREKILEEVKDLPEPTESSIDKDLSSAEKIDDEIQKSEEKDT